jgi:hypothetical protein
VSESKYAEATAVPCHTPVPIVPTVAMLEWPATGEYIELIFVPLSK